MPTILDGSIAIMSRTGIGMGMFSMGTYKNIIILRFKNAVGLFISRIKWQTFFKQTLDAHLSHQLVVGI
jgi:hypothetical protein